MLTSPVVHGPATTVGELRAFFRDDHVHMALLVDAGKLIGTIERDEIASALSEDAAVRPIATLDGTTISPDATLPKALDAMKRAGRRRLAVMAGDGTLLGLLCLKASGLGFCSDSDVSSRRCERNLLT
jgi:CBS domain-containing protein